MSTNAHTTPQRLMIAFAAIVFALVSINIAYGASSATPLASASSSETVWRGLSPSLRAIADAPGGPVRVRVLLSSNTFAKRLTHDRDVLSGRFANAAKARAAATASPRVLTSTEIRTAHEMDAARNAAIDSVVTAAAPDLKQNEKVARIIRELGGTVESALPMPNQVVAVVPRSTLIAIGQLPDVYQVNSATKPTWAASSDEGSPTWHANGFTGQGASADNVGGPDFAEIDTGIRTTHIAFKSRLPGDCGTCVGSGPSRVTSPAGRTDFSGAKHGNEIAATVASTDLSDFTKTGMAYGLDKLEDASDAKNPYYWIIGQTYSGEPGVSDLPEVVNYSAGIVEDTTDVDTNWTFYDALADRLGISMAISAGNCGVATPAYTGCSDGPHRVEAPGTNFNTLSVGGLEIPNPNDQTTWTSWANSSPGPTWGGRKKPDLIAKPTGAAAGPSAINDTDYVNPGLGTSYAAPQVAAGAVLLASVGVYNPTAQRAILINSATPIQGQTYWTPTTGWGALNLDTAYYDRGYYASGTVTPQGSNGVRFYRQTGLTSGDRTTLTWNRRTQGALPLTTSYYNLTNLDLAQVSQSTGATTASGGSDAADTVDTNPTVSAANPMPGNGTDGGDNVEQVRSTSSGTQIIKVKALSSIDGANSEPFSIAAHHPLTALQTPVPTVSVDVTPNTVAPGGTATVTATVTNSSADLALSNADVTLTPPAGVSITSGTNPQTTATINANGTTVASWTVKGNTAGAKTLTAGVSATTYGETFTGQGTATLSVDGTPPVPSIQSMPAYSPTSSPTFSWSATDADSAVANYDVEDAHGSNPFGTLLSATTQTSAAVSGSEGELIQVRARARDTLGNLSDWVTASTTVDAVPPEILFAGEQTGVRGQVTVPVVVSNSGSPVTATYSFNGAAAKSLTSSPVTFVNLGSSDTTAILKVTATDGLGRAVTKIQSYTVSSRYRSPALSLRTPKVKSRLATIAGSVASGVTGSVTVVITRRGKTGTKRVSKRVGIKSRKFSKRIRLKAGSYKLAVTVPQGNGFAASTKTKTFKVK